MTALIVVTAGLLAVAVFARDGAASADQSPFLRGLPAFSADDSHVVATVNGRPITSWELDTALAGARGQNESAARGDVLDSLINHELLLQEAERRGFSVSDDEARQYLGEMRAAMSPTDRAMLYAANVERAGFQGTEEEYWTSPRIIAATKKGMMISRLQSEIVGQAQNGIDRGAAREQALEQLRSAADIKVMVD